MGTPLRVLMVEDSANDAILLEYELKAGGYEPILERVETREALRAALERGGWELVLADYDLPQFSGVSALRMVRETAPDLPFIVVSGRIGEETAVMMMKAGAHDYIMKNNLARLIPAIGRELEEAKVRREHRRTRETLMKTEALYQQIVETANEGIWVVDENLRTTFVNPRMAEILGFTVEEMAGQPTEAFIFEEDLDDHRERMTSKREGKGNRYERRFRRKDGRGCWLLVSAAPLRDAKGRFAGLFGMFTDINDYKQAETAMREAHQRLNEIVDFLPDGTFVVNNERRVIAWNRAMEKMTGVSKNDILGKGGYEYAFPFYGERRPLLIDLAFALDDELEKRYDFVRREGNTLFGEAFVNGLNTGRGAYLMEAVSPFFDPAGNIVGAIESIRDITVLKRAEESLRRRSEELMALNGLIEKINAMLSVDEVISVATDTVAQLAESDMVLFFVREGDDLILKRTAFRDSASNHEDFPLHHVGQCLCGIAVTSEKPTYSEDINADARCTMDECRRLGFKSFAAIPLHSGPEIMGVLGLGWRSQRNLREYSAFLETIAGQVAAACRNALLHEQVRDHAAELEKRVERRTVELMAANKELEAFSYSVSHDLRAPLRSIDGFTHVLEEDYGDKLDEQGRDYLSRVQLMCRRMAGLIEGLLKLSRITRGEISRKKVDLAVMAREIAARLEGEEPDRRVEFVITGELTVDADESLMRIVLENLLGNAWKFTRKKPRAKIEVGTTRQEEKPVYFVRDDGAGFDMAYAKKLFGPFQRLHGAAEFEGTGIGLATVQRIIHRHGGRVWAEGEVEKGATFYFTL